MQKSSGGRSRLLSLQQYQRDTWLLESNAQDIPGGARARHNDNIPAAPTRGMYFTLYYHKDRGDRNIRIHHAKRGARLHCHWNR